MKCYIMTSDMKRKICRKCNGDLFRKSTRSKYTNIEKTEGLTYDLIICNNCNNREQINEIKWKVTKD